MDPSLTLESNDGLTEGFDHAAQLHPDLSFADACMEDMDLWFLEKITEPLSHYTSSFLEHDALEPSSDALQPLVPNFESTAQQQSFSLPPSFASTSASVPSCAKPGSTPLRSNSTRTKARHPRESITSNGPKRQRERSESRLSTAKKSRTNLPRTNQPPQTGTVFSDSASPPLSLTFTVDGRYVVDQGCHIPVTSFLSELRRVGPQFVYNPRGSTFSLRVRGLPDSTFSFHPAFLTLQSLTFRQLYEEWDGRCALYEITVPYPDAFSGVWEYLYTGDVGRFLAKWFADPGTLRRTWMVVQCLRVQYLPSEVIFRARLELEAVRLRPGS